MHAEILQEPALTLGNQRDYGTGIRLFAILEALDAFNRLRTIRESFCERPRRF
ncbi:MAG: hypothetical protein JOZ80_10485 [Acidobacteriaceae bacterium]|nr:hypothetical protein [Acidobacteriaceae bacterium]